MKDAEIRDIDLTQICEESGLPCEVIVYPGESQATFPPSKFSHSEYLNYLFSKTESDIVLFLDQDCLVLRPIGSLLKRLEKGTVLLGPLDLFFVAGDHVKGQHMHNWIARQSPPPGYIHAAFMLLNAGVVREKFGATEVFSYLPDVKLKEHFGGEPYYGITQRCRRAQLPIDFMFMLPGYYGVCAELAYDGLVYAVHLWYSCRIIGKKPDEFLDYYWEDGKWSYDLVNVGWLMSEKQRFLEDYWNGKLKTRWG